MRLLCTSDTHVHDWTQFSTYDEQGVPSRLKAYETLGYDLSQIATNFEVDVIVVAGDILSSSNLQAVCSTLR